MKKIALLSVLVSAMMFGQTRRFIYEYTSIPNINDKNDIKKELMALDITEKGSLYENLEKKAQDSIIKKTFSDALLKGGALTEVNMRRSNPKYVHTRYKVEKDYENQTTYLIERIDLSEYKVAEDEALKWEISPETKIIGEYKTQKATAQFGGRKWVAWFCKDIPISDGPYKFRGLPGLIIEIEDDTQSHKMILVGNKKISVPTEKEESQTQGNVRFSLSGKNIQISEKQFKKLWKDYLADPSKEIRNLKNQGNDGITRTMIVMKDASGKTLDHNEMIKMRENAVKTMLKNNNNRIEPSLYE